MTFQSVEGVQQACALVLREGRESGTGYLVAPNCIVTCEHVVGKTEAAGLSVKFQHPDEQLRLVASVTVDKHNDVAVLELAAPVGDRRPLVFCDSSPESSEWTSYGFPRAARWHGVPFSGVIESLLAYKDEQPRLQLYSQRVAEGMRTPISGVSGSPVLVGMNVIGHVSEMMADDDGRPVFGLVYAIPAARILAVLGDGAAVVATPTHPPESEINLATRNGPGRVDAALAQLQSASPARSVGDSLKGAEGLIALGEPYAALRLLGSNSNDLRWRQLHALALAKSDQTATAIVELEALRAEGNLDVETGCLLAGRYKQDGLKQNDRAKLMQARSLYRETYDRTKDPYPGINVAALTLELDRNIGRVDAGMVATEVATEVERLLREVPEDVDHWRIATLAEARLLQGRLDNAREEYKKAVEWARGRPQDIAVMRRQARRNLSNLGKDAALLDAELPVPTVAAFTGHTTDAPGRKHPRFPEAKVADVRQRVRAILDDRNVQFGVCSAARGGDLIFLSELLRRGGTARVVLPFPMDAFKQTSVGQGWDEDFEELLSASGVDLTVLQQKIPAENDQPKAFAACNRELQKLGVAQAERFDQRPLLLAVWDGSKGAVDGGTGDFVTKWQNDQERRVQVIRPLG